ncbi:metallophosphoesterase [Nocardia puris]|uniref:Icc-related predicted phosphoesterase n=1 Tax=Nocardia puris TaxID=208602 RepID=A0A366DZ53_9NOCA|nr:metallophosphoesterase [Nocardia puris]MBF6209776.1 metallophosphoesterase [Nocardia puris]MBF6366348.1 metallophosphoesterase [Nocardia puris]MBF6458313.1 metallophosphoesterase [Nocardia puris]RBO94488.1 Icc-related predicted phosphoesterase [Nocardia puris]
MRIAAVGDIHLGTDSRGTLRPALRALPDRADVLLLAGDLTRLGTIAEARVVAKEFADAGVPVVAVLGNHDHHGDVPEEIALLLADHGVTVLEGESVTVTVAGGTLGVAGTKGFGGGFAGKCASVFGERLMREFAGHTVELAAQLGAALGALDADVTVALTHYSPVPDTLRGEPPEIFPFLGSYLLGEAIDTAGADLAVHGHAHAGCERGTTPGGVPVRNVAQPVIDTAFAVYEIGDRGHRLPRVS